MQTAIGVLLGTPQYMSPEACESRRDIDHRTDVYALGILLFQMMTGVLPFDGESMGEVLVKQVTMLPAPRGINPTIPPSVEQVLLRCLAKPVDQRFQTMQALREALLDPESYLRASPPIAPARSVGPGDPKVDAKTVMMHTAAQQKTRISTSLPLPAANDPRSAATIAMELPNRQVPGLAPPTEPNNHTMRIATPMGYSSRPPRRMWPIVLVLGLVLGLGGGAFAVAWVGRSEPAVLAAREPDAARRHGARDPRHAPGRLAGAVPPDASPPVPVASDAPPAGSPGSAALRQVTLALDSERGATVLAPDGRSLGKTPLELSWPASDEAVTFELRLAGYRKKEKSIVLSTSTAITVQLDRMRKVQPTQGSNAGSDNDNGLMRPE
ncbi:MAG: protein kinase [Kofleriaceae bacterium]